MPDRLGDFLDNSEPSRHKMMCPKCSELIRGNTAVGVRIAMRHHRKHTCPKRGGEKEMVDEPPEDFDPDAVGDPEEFDAELASALADLLESEQFGELADDILLDEVGRGEDHRTIYDDMDPGEDELQDALHDIKEQPEDEPIPELIDRDEAKKIIADAKKKYDEKKAAEGRSDTQGEEPMAISDDAQQLSQVAQDESAVGAMEAATGSLGGAINQLQQAGQTLSGIGQSMQAASESVASMAATAGNLLGGAEGEALKAQGQAIAQAISDALSVIATVDTGDSVGKLQGVDLASLQGQIQQLREAIKSAAQKHQS